MRTFPANENGVAYVNIQSMFGVFVYVFNRPENLEYLVIWTLKVIFKNSFILPHLYVPTRRQYNQTNNLLLCFIFNISLIKHAIELCL
jgi:hypothetical protein